MFLPRMPGRSQERRAAGLLTLAVLAVQALLASGCCTFALGELDAPEGETIIACVHLEGAEELSEGDVLSGLSTHAAPMRISGAKPLLDPTQLPLDARRIESFYASQGYNEARVLDYRVDDVRPGHVQVVFRVREGLPTRVRRVSVHGLADADTGDPEADRRLARIERRLRSLLAIEAGQVWREQDYNESLANLRRRLRQDGFAFAEVVGETRVWREGRSAEVRIVVVSGPLARVGAVLVEGNREVTDERLLRRVNIDDGEVATQSLLDETERNVFGLGAFYVTSAEVLAPDRQALVGQQRSVQALMEAARDIPERSAVSVKVQERPVMDGQVGLGAGVETRRGEAYLLGAFGHRNIFGGLQRLELEARPALILLPSLFEPDIVAPGVKVKAALLQPSFIEEYITAGLQTAYELGVDVGFRYHQVDAGVSLTRPIWDRLVGQVGFNLGYTAFFDFTEALELPAARTLGLDFRPSYLVTELVQSLVFDGRDDPLDAKNGWYGALSSAQSFRNLGSDFHYVRFTADARGYMTFFKKLTIAARARFGQVFNVFGGDVPLSGRFRGGGPTDMRGFSSGRMGPYLCQLSEGGEQLGSDDRPCDGSKVFVGGKLVVNGSLELRYLVWGELSLAAFADVGEIWANPQDVALRDLNVAVGPGVRYRTPFGPLRLDFGFLVTDPERLPWTFHFSIGQAF